MPATLRTAEDFFRQARERLDRDFTNDVIGFEEYQRRARILEEKRFQFRQGAAPQLREPIGPESPTLPSGITDPRELGMGQTLSETERLGPFDTGPTGAETLRRKLSERTAAPGNVGSPTGATAFQGAEERFEFGPSPLLQAGRERGRAEAAEEEEDPMRAFLASLGRSPGAEKPEASTGQKIGLVLAAIGDALTTFGTGKNPQTVNQILERFEQAQAQREKRALEDQRFKLDQFKFSRQLGQDDFMRYEQSLDLALKAAKENPAMDETTRNRFIEGTLKVVPLQFRGASRAQLQGVFSSTDVMGMVSDLLPLLNTSEKKILLNSAAIIFQQSRDPVKVREFVKAEVGNKVKQPFMDHVRATAKSFQGKKGVTFHDVLTHLENTPQKGPALLRFWNDIATKEHKEEIQDAAASEFGIQPIGVAKKAAEKEALRPGEVTTARETERAKLEEQEKFKEPKKTLPEIEQEAEVRARGTAKGGKPEFAVKISRELTFRRENPGKKSDPDFRGLSDEELVAKFKGLNIFDIILGLGGQSGPTALTANPAPAVPTETQAQAEFNRLQRLHPTVSEDEILRAMVKSGWRKR